MRVVSGKALNVPLSSECWLSRARLRSSVKINPSLAVTADEERGEFVEYYLIRTKALQQFSAFLVFCTEALVVLVFWSVVWNRHVGVFFYSS